ncbi:MAG TPA: metallopeptidase family protein [Marmoricola sp.]|nr:metallopeptidase family protein [Marmoricola sp.]
MPARHTRRERFDRIALATMREFELRWPAQLATTELAVEEVPLLPEHWAAETVPLASYVEPTARTPGRIVLFRQPIEHRAESRTDLEALLLTVLVEQVAEILGIPPEEVHPGYEEE